MKKRRFIPTSDDEEDAAAGKPDLDPAPDSSPSNGRRKRGRRKILEEEEEEEEEEVDEKKVVSEEGDGEECEGDEEEEAVQEDAKPVGEVLRTSGKGSSKKSHYRAFEFDGNEFELEDPVLLTPEEKGQKPYVAIIKDITQTKDGSMMVTGQWFYRPEEAIKKDGGHWEPCDTRELFYSFHHDDVAAESVMHKCVVHFVPLGKQLPKRSQHPGFIVQKVYDTGRKRLFKLTDKDYEDSMQHEIDLLVQKTRQRIGELPDIEPEEGSGEHDDQLKSKRSFRKKNMPPIDVSRDEEGTTNRFEQSLRADTPGSCIGEASEFYSILKYSKAVTNEMHRDKWLAKLLEAMQDVCKESCQADDKEKREVVQGDQRSNHINGVDAASETRDEKLKGDVELHWPDSAVAASTALEKASHEFLGSDFQKYNQKMRQLYFNLKKNALLATRLLKKELEPTVVLNMSPTELKDGLTAEEKSTREPEEQESMQMTDAICKRCTERKVRVADIIQAGGSADRYLLECIACGNSWYSSRDAISSLTIDTPNVVSNVGTAPLATSKFETVEKLLSPRESDNLQRGDIFQKGTVAVQKPVLEARTSFNRSKTDDLTGNAT